MGNIEWVTDTTAPGQSRPENPLVGLVEGYIKISRLHQDGVERGSAGAAYYAGKIEAYKQILAELKPE